MLTLLPEIFTSACIIFLLLELCIRPHNHCCRTICALAYLMIVFGIYILSSSNKIIPTIFLDNYLVNKISFCIKGIIISLSGILILYAKNYLIARNIFKIEFF